MTDGVAWNEVTSRLAEAGWQTRVVPVERLADVNARLAEVISGSFDEDLESYLLKWIRRGLPASPTARSVIIGATQRPLTQATLTWRGEEHTVQLPPHYAGYRTTPHKLAAAARAALEPFGYSAARFEPPLKTLAACSGLAQYGYNNIAYVDGLGSYLMLAACVSDAPAPADAFWGEPHWLGRCSTCGACRKACPTGAITEHRLLLHTERCLTLHNEHTDPLPDWIAPEAHHAAVGCLRCQQACPVNKKVELLVADPERFDEAETAAILAAQPVEELSARTIEKMASCGLDYDAQLIARNVRLLLPA
jgi:epoxyqueuosine reductase